MPLTKIAVITVHPSALFFARLKETKGSFLEGAVAQATEGECVQRGPYGSSAKHLNPLFTQLLPSLARLVPPPSAGRQNLFMSRTPHPSRLPLNAPSSHSTFSKKTRQSLCDMLSHWRRLNIDGRQSSATVRGIKVEISDTAAHPSVDGTTM